MQPLPIPRAHTMKCCYFWRIRQTECSAFSFQVSVPNTKGNTIRSTAAPANLQQHNWWSAGQLAISCSSTSKILEGLERARFEAENVASEGSAGVWEDALHGGCYLTLQREAAHGGCPTCERKATCILDFRDSDAAAPALDDTLPY